MILNVPSDPNHSTILLHKLRFHQNPPGSTLLTEAGRVEPSSCRRACPPVPAVVAARAVPPALRHAALSVLAARPGAVAGWAAKKHRLLVPGPVAARAWSTGEPQLLTAELPPVSGCGSWCPPQDKVRVLRVWGPSAPLRRLGSGRPLPPPPWEAARLEARLSLSIPVTGGLPFSLEPRSRRPCSVIVAGDSANVLAMRPTVAAASGVSAMLPCGTWRGRGHSVSSSRDDV